MSAPEIKSLTLKEKEFTANGKRYFVMDKISPERWKEYEKLVPVLTFGLSFESMFANLSKLWEHLNKQKFGDAAVICHNMMKGITDANDPKRVHPALMLAALVINQEGENVKTYDEQVMRDKINDWTVEGLDMLGFIALSRVSIQGFNETLIKYTQENLTILESELKKE